MQNVIVVYLNRSTANIMSRPIRGHVQGLLLELHEDCPESLEKPSIIGPHKRVPLANKKDTYFPANAPS